MLLFLDTEFTDFIDCHLISIGLVAEDGRQFYCERNDYPKESCSPFVLAAVVPQLGGRPDCIADREGLKQRLGNWLGQFRSDADVIVCFDYGGDWDLFCDALDDIVPGWIRGANIKLRINEVLVAQHFQRTGLYPHHALHDALANKFAYLSEP